MMPLPMHERPPTNNHRHYVRPALGLPAVVRLQGQELGALVTDISLKGALLKLDTPLPQPCALNTALHLDLLSDPERILLLSLNAEVRHASSHWLGVSWPTIDLDNLTTLRQLLIANVADDQQIDRELSELFSTAQQAPTE
ncbi:PilZ domain-containing protein [Halothiobacillus sp. DCM-1]|uniref:PilZ domain-containing protein n=1 Tax=Halothiobacillus sp. DCM-1 TaxID=3112558 RepID=UPI0032433B69